nr:hypothetical protein [Tanacetum cinerariifolium]
ANHAAANHYQVLGHFADVQGLCAGDDALLVLLNERQHRGLRARGDNDILRFYLLGLTAFQGRNAQVVFVNERTDA